MGIINYIGRLKAKRRADILRGHTKSASRLQAKAEYSKKLEKQLKKEKKAREQIERTNKLKRENFKAKFKPVTGAFKNMKKAKDKLGLTRSSGDLFGPTKSRDDLFGPSRKKKGGKEFWEL